MTLLHWMDRARQEASYAARGLRRSPGFTITVIVTLALGFGVNAAMYSMLDQIFRRPPAGVATPGNVRRLYRDLARAKEPGGRLAVPHFTYPHVRAVSLAAATTVGAFTESDSVTLADSSMRIPARASEATRGFFDVLELRPSLGRFFTAEEDRIETPTPVAVISNDLWHRAFHADPAVLGKRITIDHRPITIVGVGPRDFTGIDLDATDLWLPANMVQADGSQGPWYQGFSASFALIANVRTPADEARLTGAATAALRTVHVKYLEYDSTTHLLAGSILEANGPTRHSPEMDVATRVSWTALLVLLIACCNVVNLLLLRATSRAREIAVRRALGVSHARLIEQLAIESALLSVLAGGVALVIAWWAGGAFRHLLMPRVHWSAPVIDMHTAALVLGLSLAVGLAAGLVPGIYALRPNLADSLKAGMRGSGYRASRLRSVLLVLQTAFCVVLLAGAGLFLRSLDNVRSIPLGYDAQNVSFVYPVFTTSGRHDAQLASALPEVTERLSHVGGVEAAAYATVAPLRGMSYINVFLPGRTLLPRLSNEFGPSYNGVSPNYFRAAGIPIVKGREFNASDLASPGGSVIVSDATARLYWPGENPLGKCLIVGARTSACSTVVGVAADAHLMRIIEQPTTRFYLPVAGDRRPPGTIIVRARTARSAVVIRETQRLLTASLPGIDGTIVRNLSDAVEPELRPWRLGATLFTSFAVLALAVACVGIYSVVAYGVRQRAHEMAVRSALGARMSDIMDLVLGEGMRVLAAGIAIGAAAALLLGRLVAALLFGVTARDPSVLIGAATALCVFGALACLIPAWTAARTNPAEALRSDG